MSQVAKKIKTSLIPLIGFMAVLLTGCSDSMMVMDPKGPVGAGQRDLIIQSSVLCLIILIPVLALTAWIVYKYRDKPENKATYQPNWSHSTKLEIIWWGIPIVIIAILGIITVKATYQLEPSKPLESEKKPVIIQVTSLDWKWLFTYPEQGISTVNYLSIPEDTPIKFELTADAPMNSFWIPQLGGQIYTMSGMAMTLHLQADEPGEYFGSGANFSGEHFADMRFTVKATSDQEFTQWVNEIKRTAPALTMDGYHQLAEKGTSQPTSFSSFPEGLFHQIVTKYTVNGQMHNHGSTGTTTEAPKEAPKAPAKEKSTASTEHEHHH